MSTETQGEHVLGFLLDRNTEITWLRIYATYGTGNSFHRLYYNFFKALTYLLKILSLSVLYTLSASLWLKHPLSIPNSIMFLKKFKPLLKTSRRFGGFSLMFYWIFITVADTHTQSPRISSRKNAILCVTILPPKTLTRGLK